jgi:hypothetical protein
MLEREWPLIFLKNNLTVNNVDYAAWSSRGWSLVINVYKGCLRRSSTRTME